MTTETRIIVADNHPLLREGLRQVIASDEGLSVVGEADDGEAALALIEAHRPDVAVLDITMPNMDGFELARAIRGKGLPVHVIFLTIHDEEDMVNEALDLGARGYVLKEGAIKEIVFAIKAVVKGQSYLSPSITAHLVNRQRRAAALLDRKPGLAELSPRERQILSLIAEAKTSKEIAAALRIDYRTVENHRNNICRKLDLHGTNALLTFALNHKSELT